MTDTITLRYCQKCKRYTLQVEGAPYVEEIWQQATHLVKGAHITGSPFYCSLCGTIWIPCEPLTSPNFDKEFKKQ